MSTFLGVIVWIVIIFAVVAKVKSEKAQKETRTAGARQITCPHCGTKGTVSSDQVRQKQGISGGKATGAILTGGLSMLATGLSRKQNVTKLTCGNCHTTWHVA